MRQEIGLRGTHGGTTETQVRRFGVGGLRFDVKSVHLAHGIETNVLATSLHELLDGQALGDCSVVNVDVLVNGADVCLGICAWRGALGDRRVACVIILVNRADVTLRTRAGGRTFGDSCVVGVDILVNGADMRCALCSIDCTEIALIGGKVVGFDVIVHVLT